MARKPKAGDGEDNSHYGAAFKIAAEREEARERLSRAKSSGARNLLSKTIREKDAKLKGLTDRDRLMTRVLAEYQRRNIPRLDADREMIMWLRGESDELGTYTEFLDWCRDTRDQLARLEDQRRFTGAKARRLAPAEARFISGLDEIAGLDERTIRRRLRDQYGAHGTRGRPKHK